RLAACAGKAVKVWDAATGRRLLVLGPHRSQVFQLAFSPDGKRLAAATGTPFQNLPAKARRQDLVDIKVWDLAGRREVFTVHPGMPLVNGLAFSPNGKYLAAAGGDATVPLWEAATGKKVHTLRGHRIAVRKVVFSPRGSLLASAGGDATV